MENYPTGGIGIMINPILIKGLNSNYSGHMKENHLFWLAISSQGYEWILQVTDLNLD